MSFYGIDKNPERLQIELSFSFGLNELGYDNEVDLLVFTFVEIMSMVSQGAMDYSISNMPAEGKLQHHINR